MDRPEGRDEQDDDRRREQGARPGVRGGLQGGEGDPGGKDHQQHLAELPDIVRVQALRGKIGVRSVS